MLELRSTELNVSIVDERNVQRVLRGGEMISRACQCQRADEDDVDVLTRGIIKFHKSIHIHTDTVY
jgi:hypothetical protein